MRGNFVSLQMAFAWNLKYNLLSVQRGGFTGKIALL
jgi:hypothetical protein